MLTITKDLREWLPDDVIGAVMDVQVQAIVSLLLLYYYWRRHVLYYHRRRHGGPGTGDRVSGIVFVAVAVYMHPEARGRSQACQRLLMEAEADGWLSSRRGC